MIRGLNEEDEKMLIEICKEEWDKILNRGMRNMSKITNNILAETK